MRNELPQSFYTRDDVVAVARDLIGKQLFTYIEGQITGGTIVETEAYRGPDDRGSHAYNNKRTPRNETMYAMGGVIYMYICYGIHDMLNIVTGSVNTSHAVLIRAVEPTTGIGVMRERRVIFDNDRRLCRGPGALAKAFGLSKAHDGTPLDNGTIWIENNTINLADDQITASPRIGLNIEEPYKSVPWRFYVKGNKFVSARKS